MGRPGTARPTPVSPLVSALRPPSARKPSPAGRAVYRTRTAPPPGRAGGGGVQGVTSCSRRRMCGRGANPRPAFPPPPPRHGGGVPGWHVVPHPSWTAGARGAWAPSGLPPVPLAEVSDIGAAPSGASTPLHAFPTAPGGPPAPPQSRASSGAGATERLPAVLLPRVPTLAVFWSLTTDGVGHRRPSSRRRGRRVGDAAAATGRKGETNRSSLRPQSSPPRNPGTVLQWSHRHSNTLSSSLPGRGRGLRPLAPPPLVRSSRRESRARRCVSLLRLFGFPPTRGGFSPDSGLPPGESETPRVANSPGFPTCSFLWGAAEPA